MDIQNLVFHAPRVEGEWWTFDVDYSAVFTPAEVSQRNNYADNIALMEDDDVDDDTVVPFGVMQGWQVTKRQYDWTWTIRVHQDDLDTEWGNEEIYAQLRLRKTFPPPMSVDLVRNTSIRRLDP
jgi:hypothetical protein